MRTGGRKRRLGLPAAALAAGLPALVAGMLVAPSPSVLAGPDDDTVRTVLADEPPKPAGTGEVLDGAHPVTDPGTQVLDTRLDSTARDDRNRGVPVRVSGTALPARVLLAYRNAAASLRDSDPGCHLSWSLVAGIGKVESGHAFGGAVDRSGRTVRPILGPVLDGAGDFAAIPDTDGGRWDGDTTWDRAVGPMQFIPSSWAVWGRDGDGNGSTDPSDIDDAALATASYLCAGDRDLTDEKDRRSAVFSYNHSWDYVDLVLAWADAYATGSTTTGTLAGGGGPGGGGPDDGATDALGPPIGATPKPTTPAASASASVTGTTTTAAQPTASPAPTVEPAPAPTSATPAPGPTTAPATVPPSPDPTGTAAPPGCPTPTPTGTTTPDPSGSPAATPDPTPTTPDPTPTADPTGSATATPTACPTP